MPIKTAAAIAVLLFTMSAPAAEDSMALIPAGEFWMGRVHFFLIDEVGWNERDRRDDSPARKVYVESYYIDKYEVTNEEYARFAAATGVAVPWYWPAGKIAAGEERFPVHDVNWAEAVAYCEWIGKRLPTEAEWERAARGGLDKQQFSWGNEPLGMAGYEADADNARGSSKRAHVSYPWGPVAVGSFPANGFGLFDVTGNVWEWTSDWYQRDYYTVAGDRNPQGPPKGTYRVIRGGGWSDDDERNLMNHYRNYADPLTRAYTIGLRCAKSVVSK